MSPPCETLNSLRSGASGEPAPQYHDQTSRFQETRQPRPRQPPGRHSIPLRAQSRGQCGAPTSRAVGAWPRNVRADQRPTPTWIRQVSRSARSRRANVRPSEAMRCRSRRLPRRRLVLECAESHEFARVHVPSGAPSRGAPRGLEPTTLDTKAPAQQNRRSLTRRRNDRPHDRVRCSALRTSRNDVTEGEKPREARLHAQPRLAREITWDDVAIFVKTGTRHRPRRSCQGLVRRSSDQSHWSLEPCACSPMSRSPNPSQCQRCSHLRRGCSRQ